MTFGECDACGKLRVLHHSIAYGIETSACAECIGGDLDDDFYDYFDLAERYIRDWINQGENR